METARKKPGPPKTKGKDPVRSIRVPDDEWDSWLSAAHANGESVAATVRRMMNRWAKRQ